MLKCKKCDLTTEGSTIMTKTITEYKFEDTQVIEIKDYMTVPEYLEEKSRINLNNITFNVLWNSEKQCINKGIVFVFFCGELSYNVLIADGFYKIDEVHKCKKSRKEKLLKYKANFRDYYYASMIHNEAGSTINTSCYSKNPNDIFGLTLTPKEAYDDILKIMENLQCVSGIENALDLESFTTFILEDIKSKIEKSL